MSSEQAKNKEENGTQQNQKTEEQLKKGEKEKEKEDADQKKSKKQSKKKRSSSSKSSKSRSKSRSKKRSKSKKSKKDKKKKHRSSSSSSKSSSRRRHKKKKRSKSRSRRDRDRDRRRRSKSFSSKKSDKKLKRDKFQWDSPPKDEVEQKQQQTANVVKPQPQEPVVQNNPLKLGLQGLGLLQIPQNPLATVNQGLGVPGVGAMNSLNQTQEMIQKMQLVQMMKNLQNQNANSDKKLYIGNLPPNITPQTLCDVLNSALQKMNINTNPGNSVINCWISPDGHYGFAEFRTIEETTNGFALNNVAIFGQPLKVGRPRTYQQAPNPLASMNQMGGMPEIPGLTGMGGISMPGMAGMPGAMGLPGMMGLPGATGFGNPLMAQVNPATAMMNPLGLGLGQFGGLGAGSFGGVGGIPNAAQAGLLSQLGGTDLNQLQNSLGMQQSTIEQTVPTIQKIQPPSRILVLKNMVSTHELEIDEEYNDILEEVKEECEKYGKVLSIKIPRPTQGKNVSGLGKVFVEFTSIDQAKEARKNLSGRTFADNTVECSYHDEKMYAAENFND